MTQRDRVPLLCALAWLGLFVAFSVWFNARWDFQVCLYVLETVAWVVSLWIARRSLGMAGSMFHARRPRWVRTGGLAVITLFFLFPFGALAFGSALDVCAAIRNWLGPYRPISAQYFFNEFTGLHLDHGLSEWAGLSLSALWVGGIAAIVCAPVVFAAAWALDRLLKDRTPQAMAHPADRI